MLQRGLGLSCTVGGQRERRPSVDVIGHLWSIGGQRERRPSLDVIRHLWSVGGRHDSVQVRAQ